MTTQSIENIHVDDLLRICVDRKGSDLHISAFTPPVIRVDGQLIVLREFMQLNEHDVQRLVYEILKDEQITKYERTLELDASYTIKGYARFRFNVYRERGAVAAAFRPIPSKIPTLESLLLPPIVGEQCQKQRGLILVTGPTGSGKSTTLAAMIGLINQERACHIITIEDPIEYLHANKQSVIHQRELGADTQDFKAALRSALREDPDIILVGEMRDQETMQLAITAAETGHLVLSTVHTNDTASTISRIVDVFPPDQQDQIRIQLSNSLKAIFSQQLLPRKDKNGRIVAMEILIANAAVRSLIRSNKPNGVVSTIQTSAHEGMKLMDKYLADLYEQDLIEYSVAIERAHDPNTIKQLLATH